MGIMKCSVHVHHCSGLNARHCSYAPSFVCITAFKELQQAMLATLGKLDEKLLAAVALAVMTYYMTMILIMMTTTTPTTTTTVM